MFAIATPQTIKLPDACTITFRTDGDDVSRCVMDVQVEGGEDFEKGERAAGATMTR